MVLNALNTNDCQIIFNNEQNSVHLITYVKNLKTVLIIRYQYFSLKFDQMSLH